MSNYFKGKFFHITNPGVYGLMFVGKFPVAKFIEEDVCVVPDSKTQLINQKCVRNRPQTADAGRQNINIKL